MARRARLKGPDALTASSEQAISPLPIKPLRVGARPIAPDRSSAADGRLCSPSLIFARQKCLLQDKHHPHEFKRTAAGTAVTDWNGREAVIKCRAGAEPELGARRHDAFAADVVCRVAMSIGDSCQMPEHGGEVDAAAEQYGIARDRWLDLSTGINPKPYPLPELAREYWHRLPDASLDVWLRESAASYYRVTDPEQVVAAPGSQAIIQCLPRLLPATRVAVVAPTYREHVTCWSAAQHRVVEVRAPEEVPEDTGIVVLRESEQSRWPSIQSGTAASADGRAALDCR